ncbi:MAG: SpoIVB peptidase S55 domain-containing protein [Planctomycetota bacterium]
MKTRLFPAGACIGLALIVLVAAVGCREERVIVSGPDRYLAASAITPGMRGFGRTVFRGDTIEDFDVTVISVMRNWAPGSDMILVEVRHPVVDEAGIIAGMSGSPVYINGRLIGAVAYGWSFSKRAIAGITPIAEMLAAPPVVPAGGAGGLLDPAAGTAGPAPAGTPRPLTMPLTVGGGSPAFRQFLTAELARRNLPFAVVAAGAPAAGAAPAAAGGLAEGSAVAVKLVTGDLDLSAVGTVTCIDRGTVYAFGHPFTLGGAVSLPMATAWVHTVIASMDTSFKLAAAGPTLGEFTADYARAIRGTLGRTPRTVPVEAVITNADTGVRVTRTFAVAHDRRWTGFMTFLAVYAALDETPVYGGDLSAWIDAEIEAEGVPLITGHDFLLTGGRPGFGNVIPLWDRIEFLMDNPYRPLDIRSVRFRITVKSGRAARIIERASADRRRVAPGGTVNITLELRPYRGAIVREILPVTLPADMPEGPVRIDLYNGLAAPGHDVRRAPGRRRPETIAQAAALLNDPYDANVLVVDLVTPATGLVVEGEEFTEVPESVARIYRDLQDGRYTPTGEFLRERRVIVQKGVIGGEAAVEVVVDRFSP